MKRVKLDCKKIYSRQAFHKELARLMDFSDHYGENLDALWDELTQEKAFKISLINSKYLVINLGDYGEKILNLFRDIEKEDENYKIGLY